MILLQMALIIYVFYNFLGEKIKEERWKYMQELFIKRSKAFSMAGGLLNQVPWCRFFIPQISGYSLITNLNRQISEIIEVPDVLFLCLLRVPLVLLLPT